MFTDRGVTFSYAGEDRPFPLDLIPRILDAAEWDTITRAVAQRVRTLECFLADVYGAGNVFADRVVPRRLVLSSAHFHRAAYGIEPANGVRVHVSGVDLIRDETGEFRVLEDNVRIPSGVSHVIENRRALSQTLPSLFAEARVHPVDDYPPRLLAALRAAAPEGVVDPCVVVLTPGVYNAAYFEHALLARLMGVELVEGSLVRSRPPGRTPAARETISSEMWECLNVTWHSLPTRRLAAERLGPTLYLGFVRERAAVLTGLAESTMSRDDGWRFLVPGRNLERVDMTARLLAIQALTSEYGSESPPPYLAQQWRTVLRACGADESFVRTHGGAVQPQRVAEFLLLDRLFPRSALHALTEAEECLEALAPSTERAGTADAARRPVGQARTRLAYADAATLVEDMPSHLRALQQACAAASVAVTARYFDQTMPVTWAPEGV